jgi:hypothetical protein
MTKAIIIDTVVDLYGVSFDVRERRPTKHGFDLLFGWPSGKRGMGHGAPRVILTSGLADYLESIRLTPGSSDLPISRSAIKRLRFILRHCWKEDLAAWWKKNLQESGKGASAFYMWRKRLGMDDTQRPGSIRSFWTEDMDQKLLELKKRGKTTKEISDILGRSPYAVFSRKRRLARKEKFSE